MTAPYTLKALPQTPQLLKDDGIQETPGPVRARLAMMDKQMDQLHKEKSLLERKHKAESSSLQMQVSKLQAQLKDTNGALDTSQNQLHRLETGLASAQSEISRLKAVAQQVEQMREAGSQSQEIHARHELEMRLAKQKAGLQAAKQQLAYVELERQYLKLESRYEHMSVENENHINEAQSNAKSLHAERASRMKIAKDLEKIQQAYHRLQQRFIDQEEASAAIDLQTTELQASIEEANQALTRETDKVLRAEKVVADLKEKNQDLQKELDDLVKGDTGRSGETEKEIRALRVEIKGLKSSMASKEVDLEEAQEELQKIRNETREKDRALRKESREVEALQDKITSLEEENHELREKNAHILVKARAYRQQAKGLASAADDDHGEPVEREENAAPPPKQKTTTAGKKTMSDEPANAKKLRKARAASEESVDRSDVEPLVAEPKEKKRKQTVDTRPTMQEDKEDIAPAPKRRAPATKPMYIEDSTTAEDTSRPKKSPLSQPLGERSDGVANSAAGKANNTDKSTTSGKKGLPATVMEESESEEPPKRPKALSTVAAAKDDQSGAKAVGGGEKKKKRKLGALLGGTTFTWDQNAHPDGPIPASLSPLKSSAGSIPRAGFAGGMTRRV